MKILVTIKEVADPESPFTISEPGKAIVPGRDTLFRMNRYDEFALEEALRIKEKIPGTTVTAISAGTMRSENVIRRALEMGADDGFLVLVPEGLQHHPETVSRLISEYAKPERYDCILAGTIAEDTLRSQTGQMIAARLGVACATSVVSLAVDPGKRTAEVQRELDALNRERIILKLPVLITVQSGINRPRYPSLTNKLRARRQEIRKVEPGVYPVAGNSTYRIPAGKKQAVILEGTAREKAASLKQLLKERGVTR